MTATHSAALTSWSCPALMRFAWPLGLLAALLLLLPPLSYGMYTGCDNNGTAYVPSSVPLPQPALYELNTEHYNQTLCLYSFSQLQEAYRNSQPCYNLLPIMVITCPQQCSRALLSSQQPLVLGSYPYHPSSSVCLSAIHAGIITSEAGGGVFAERFYPETWADDSTQSIYPHGSHLPTLSNGVQTARVPESETRTPASLYSYSWTVRTRGLSGRQRQRAPFSPRAGHTHLNILILLQDGIASQQLIIGGHNATHFMNDVWLYQAFHEPLTVLDRQARNGRWLRLPDAPFSPRSEMVANWITPASRRNTYHMQFDVQNMSVALFYGGQTGYSCGARELGHCSDEIWQLNISMSQSDSGLSSGPGLPALGLSFSWSAAPVGQLTFGARCGLSLIADQRRLTTGQMRMVGLAGGQLSYPDTADCSAAIDTRNDVWYSSWPDLFQWRLGRAAPFSPRRSMVEDDAYLTSDDEYRSAAYGQYRITQLTKSSSLAGGLRYIAHRVDNATGKVVITRAEVYADVYSCTLPTPELEPAGALDCDWSHSFPLANSSAPPPYAPTGSLPLPVAFGASMSWPTSTENSLVRYGGVSSAAALADWLSTRPSGAADAFTPVDWSTAPSNISLITQPMFIDSLAAAAVGGIVASGLREVMTSRQHLPLAYSLDEAELNSAASDYVLGSAAVVTHLLPLDLNKLQWHISTLHLQPQQMVQTPEEATDAVPQAASALNTTRSAFAFSMRRRGHTVHQVLDTTYVVAGQSGGLYYNDWIATTAQACLWPMDPSYMSLLGPLSSVQTVEFNTWVLQRTGPEFREYYFPRLSELPVLAPTTLLRVRCAAGHHFSPPLEDESATLTCTGAGLWLDLTLGAVRRCVPDVLQCDWPFVDAGFGHCIDPEPEVTSIRLHMVAALGQALRQPRNYNNGTVVELPDYWLPTLRHRQLFVYGSWLTTPLDIQVLALPCEAPTLHNASRHCTGDGQLCRDYASIVSCTLYGITEPESSDTLPVVMTVGRRQRFVSFVLTQLADTDWESEQLSIRLAPPSIISIDATDCSPNSTALELVGCPGDRAFNLRICGDNVPLYPNNGVPPRVSLGSGSQLLCGRWTQQIRVQNDTECIDPLVSAPCWQQSVCSTCRVQPLVGTGHVLRLVLGTGLSNDQQNLVPERTARVSFAACSPGSRAELRLQEDGSVRQFCIECEPGFSTLGLPDQRSCTPCAPGTYAPHSTSAVCVPCPLGRASSQQNASECLACGANAWARFEGENECNECGDAQYKRLPPWLNSSEAVQAMPTCEPCPSGARCERNGSVTAVVGNFLIINSQTGVVTAVDCAQSSCVEVTRNKQCLTAAASFDDADATAVLRIGPIGPAVINCCGANRRPPVDAAGVVNVLCAGCVEGHSVVHAECIPCSSVHWGPLCALLLLAALLVYLLHRLFQDASGSATMPILTYFVQMSTLFLAQDALPMVLSLVSVDLVAEGGSGSGLGSSDMLRTCIVPLTDIGKMLVRLLSPGLFAVLLALLLGLQLASRRAINAYYSQLPQVQWQQSAVVKAYRKLLPAVSEAELKSPASPPAAQSSRLPSPAASDLWSPLTSPNNQTIALVSWPQQDLSEPLVLPQDSDQADETETEGAPALPSASAACATGDSLRGIVVYYLRTLVRLAQYSYNTVTLVSLAAFRTVDVAEFGYRLQQYPSVDTGDPQYTAIAALFVVVLVVVVAGGPIALLAYLTHCYRLRIVGRSKSEAPDAVPRAERASDTSALLLTACFKPRFWWYPVIILLRRLLLIIVLTFVQRSVYSWLTIVNYGFLTLHLLLWPYLHQRDSALELLTLLALSTQTAVASAYPTLQSRPGWVSGLLWLLFSLPLCVGVVTALWARCWLLAQSGRCCRCQCDDSEESQPQQDGGLMGDL